MCMRDVTEQTAMSNLCHHHHLGVIWRSLAPMLLLFLARLLLQNELMDLRDCMSWRLSDAALLRPCVWSGREHAASAVLASHHGNASGQICMIISALTDLCLLPPHW